MPKPDPPPHEDTDRRSRARAAGILASNASNPAFLDQLVAFLLDSHDTAVTVETAAALLHRGGIAGIRPIAKAWAQSRDAEYLDHIYGELITHLMPRAIRCKPSYATATPSSTTPDPAVASGACQLLVRLQPWTNSSHTPSD